MEKALICQVLNRRRFKYTYVVSCQKAQNRYADSPVRNDAPAHFFIPPIVRAQVLESEHLPPNSKNMPIANMSFTDCQIYLHSNFSFGSVPAAYISHKCVFKSAFHDFWGVIKPHLYFGIFFA